MANNHVIEYLAIDLTGFLDLEKPQLRDPGPEPLGGIQIRFMPGKIAYVERPRPLFVLPEGVRPTADMLMGYFACRPNPRPLYVLCAGRKLLIDSYPTWVELCDTMRGDLEQ